jgi:nucleoid DNA-binding protein
MSSITKRDLIQHLKKQFSDYNLTEKFLSHFVDDIFDTISYEIVESESLMIANFGRFIIKHYGEDDIKKIEFLPSRSLKSKVNL